jgi:hypothetical protein
VPGAAFVVLSIVIGMARAGAIVLAVLAAVFPTVLLTILAPVFSAVLATIFTARGFIGLASDGRGGEQGARDEQCSTQL